MVLRPGRHARPSERRGRLGLAASLGVGALLVGAVVLSTVGGAQAVGTTVNETGIQLFGQINNNSLAGVQNLEPSGTPSNTAGHTLAITISPSNSVAGGSAYEISISSPTLTICNGPAAASPASGEELDAVVAVNGTTYQLRGPQNTVAVPASAFNSANHAACAHPLFQTGWVVSSTAGNSSGKSDTAGTAASTGLGAALIGSPGTPVTLTAPNVITTYPITLKALAVNTLGTTAGLTDPFDELINLDNGGHSAADANGVSFCDNAAICPAYAGPGGTVDQTPVPANGNGEGSFYLDDPNQYISAASATPHTPTAADSTFMNPTARNIADPASTTWSAVNLIVTSSTSTQSAGATVTETVTAPAATVTETVTETAPGPTVTETTTAPGPTVTETTTAPGPTVTETSSQGATATVTETAPGPTVTETTTAPGPTVTETVGPTPTATVTTTVPGPTTTQTVTETAPGPTVTETVTQSVPGPTTTETATTTQTATATVTETATPTATQTVTQTATETATATQTVPGPTTTATATVTETVTEQATATKTVTAAAQVAGNGNGNGEGNGSGSGNGSGDGSGGTLAATGPQGLIGAGAGGLLLLVLGVGFSVITYRRRPQGRHV